MRSRGVGRVLLPFLALVLDFCARAEEPVLSSGDQASALRRVAARTGRRATEFVSVGVAAPHPPRLLGAGELHWCDSLSSPKELTTALERAEGLWSYGHDPSGPLVDAAATIDCLAVAEPRAMGRVYLLRGLSQVDRGLLEDARKSFARAVDLDPTMAWDENEAPQGQPLFEQAHSDPAEDLRVQLVAPNGGWTLEVDNAANRGSLRTGDHHIVLRGPRGEVFAGRLTAAGPGPLQLVVPEAFPTDLAAWVDDAETRPNLGPWIAAVFAPGQAVIVAGDGLWMVHAGQDDWSPLPRHGRERASRSWHFFFRVPGLTRE